MDFSTWPAAEKRGILAALSILLIGVLLAAIIAAMNLDSAAFIALLVVALIAYGIVSGKIQEFSAPGGWVAKFQQVAAEKVKPASLTECIQNIQVVQKGGLQALKDAGQKLEKGKPVALTLKLGQQNYNKTALKQYIEALRRADSEMVILFLDANGRLIATAEAETLLSLIRDASQSSEIFQAIENSDAAYLRSLPGFHWETITRERSNAEALQLLREANMSTIVVVDSDKIPIGIVKRDDIIARLIVELAGNRQSQ
jgi:predicted RNase H-like HicB family nuclease